MDWDKVRNEYVLSTGTRVYANRGFLGLNPDLDCAQGYDGSVEYGDLSDHDAQFTPEERREIAAHMVTQWQEWAKRTV
jgi:hypothetical protein